MASSSLASLVSYPALDRLIRAAVEVWPGHEGFLSRRFEDEEQEHLAAADTYASFIERIAGDSLGSYCRDYKSMCATTFKLELEYRRTASYGRERQGQVLEELYRDRELMVRYLRGLLISQPLWRHHWRALQSYRSFLARLPDDFELLDIGPGHGLGLVLAASDPRSAACTGWDVSEASLAESSAALDRTRTAERVTLELRDITQPAESRAFDGVVISQVLESMDAPEEVLARVGEMLSQRGKAFISLPIRGGAPDHIQRWNAPEEALALIESSGLAVESHDLFSSEPGNERAALALTVIAGAGA